MGRWAQRRHCGGGPPTSAVLIIITLAEYGGPAESLVATYSADVNAGDFDPLDFESDPAEIPCISIAQGGSNSLILTFDADVDQETLLKYHGDTPGVLSPQFVDITA